MPFFKEVIIRNLGGSSPCTLTDVTAPWPSPVAQIKYGVNLQLMRPSSGRQFRIAQLSGASEENSDFVFSSKGITAEQHALLLPKYIANPPTALELSIDSGVTYYRVVWQQDGYIKVPWSEDYFRAGVELKFHSLGIIV